MAIKTIEQLRKERDNLLKTSGAKRLEGIERNKLEREIKALKNPLATSAKRSLKQFGKKSLTFLKTRADIISENIERMEKRELQSKRINSLKSPMKKIKRSRSFKKRR